MATKLTPPIDHQPGTGSRLDVPLHDLLQKPGAPRPRLQPVEPLGLPDPVFPLRPELLGDEPLEADIHGAPDDLDSRSPSGLDRTPGF